ncbi:MAG: hypothetical protein CMP38_04360 [Rickettsiales bacterium]|nr:hypothetical protein [Rickettsiales bacterium]
MKILSQSRITYRIVILMGLISLVVTCSSTRFIYTFVDEFVKDEITYFLKLDEDEKVLLNKQVSEMVNWHRTSMLPRYADYLNNIADKLQKDEYGADDINKLLSNGRFLIEETVSGLVPYASKFIINHQTSESIEFMKNRMLIRRQERIIELSKPGDVLYEERLERLTSNFERFFGDLKDSQVILLEKHARVTMGDSRVRLHNRTLRQKVFIRFLRTQPSEKELTIFLNKLLLEGHLITNQSYKAFSEGSLNKFHSLLVNLLANSSKIQRERIINKLRDYTKDFRTVSG